MVPYGVRKWGYWDWEIQSHMPVGSGSVLALLVEQLISLVGKKLAQVVKMSHGLNKRNLGQQSSCIECSSSSRGWKWRICLNSGVWVEEKNSKIWNRKGITPVREYWRKNVLNRNTCCSQCRSWVQSCMDLWADTEELLNITALWQADGPGPGFSVLQFYTAYQVVVDIQLCLFSHLTAQTTVSNSEWTSREDYHHPWLLTVSVSLCFLCEPAPGPGTSWRWKSPSDIWKHKEDPNISDRSQVS